jgi:hypothetical protein
MKSKYKQNWINHLERMDFQNMPSTTNLGGEEIMDSPGKEGNASMPEQVK